MSASLTVPLRVVAGTAGGLRLQAPHGRDVRPTTGRVREAVFSSLTSLGVLDEARVVDLFAGSGALGIEALSRGAVSATFVDRDRAAVDAIEANLGSTGLAGGTVVRLDAIRFLADAPAFDVAFVDPPYEFDGWKGVLGALEARVAVLESDRALDVGERFELLNRKRYGGTVVTLVRAVED